MINKIYDSFETAVADIPDGAVIMMGNFAGPGGFPVNLCRALHKKGVKNLTLIANTAGGIGLTLKFDDHKILFEAKQVKKMIASFPFSPSASNPTPCGTQVASGEVELELLPQGTLAERIRAGGYGIAEEPGYRAIEGGVERKQNRRFTGPSTLIEGRRRRLLTAADGGRGLVQTLICEASHISVQPSLSRIELTGRFRRTPVGRLRTFERQVTCLCCRSPLSGEMLAPDDACPLPADRSTELTGPMPRSGTA